MKDNIHSYFASPIFYEDKPEWLDELNKICQPYINDSKENFKQETKLCEEDKNDFAKVYHSVNLIDDPRLKFFIDAVGTKSVNMLNYMGFDLTHHSLIWQSCWVQEFTKTGGGLHRVHIHENCHMSGFYFLETEGSYPIFHDTRPGAAMTALPELDTMNLSYANKQVHYQPEPGALMLFPSYMPHEYFVSNGDPFKFIHVNLTAVSTHVVRHEGPMG